jgi:taurine dioxygenase
MASHSMSWQPLSGSFGAEVALDLNQPLSDSIRSQLVEVFNDRQLLVFKGQDISLEMQVQLASVFAELVADPPVPHENVHAASGRFITNVVGEENARGGELDFHTECAYLDPPIYGLALWAEEASRDGAATLFVSNRDAYDELPTELRAQVADLSAHHVSLYPNNPPRRTEEIPPDAAFRTEHPLLYIHPRTGRQVLFLSHRWTHSIVGWPSAESIALLSEIEAVVYRPDRIYRHAWEPHDLVIWDNICVQHAREEVELGGSPRRIRRVTIGDPTRYEAA